jgi:hypothetical protein
MRHIIVAVVLGSLGLVSTAQAAPLLTNTRARAKTQAVYTFTVAALPADLVHLGYGVEPANKCERKRRHIVHCQYSLAYAPMSMLQPGSPPSAINRPPCIAEVRVRLTRRGRTVASFVDDRICP